VKEKSWWLAQYPGCATTVAGLASGAGGSGSGSGSGACNVTPSRPTNSLSLVLVGTGQPRGHESHEPTASNLACFRRRIISNHTAVRDKTSTGRGVWAYVSRACVPRRPLKLLFIRTIRELPHRQRRFPPSFPAMQQARKAEGGALHHIELPVMLWGSNGPLQG
jgi:hypothetical protein